MKHVYLICVYPIVIMLLTIGILGIIYIEESDAAVISTNVVRYTSTPTVAASMVLIELRPYIGNRQVFINGLPSAKSWDDSYSRLLSLKRGVNFVKFAVIEGTTKYQKVKKVTYSRYKKYKYTAPHSNRQSEFSILKNKFDKPEDPMDTRLKYDFSGHPPIPVDLPFIKKNMNFDFMLTVSKKF